MIFMMNIWSVTDIELTLERVCASGKEFPRNESSKIETFSSTTLVHKAKILEELELWPGYADALY
jgi:hypothetical protein